MLRSEHREAESTAGWAAAENAFPTVALAATMFIINTITMDTSVQNRDANYWFIY